MTRPMLDRSHPSRSPHAAGQEAQRMSISCSRAAEAWPSIHKQLACQSALGQHLRRGVQNALCMGISQGRCPGQSTCSSKLLGTCLGLDMQLSQPLPALLLQEHQQQAVTDGLDLSACSQSQC